MKSRGMIVVLAFLLAAGATGAVYLYVNGVKQEASTGGALSTIIVSKQDIPAGTDLDSLIEQGVFREAEVPADDLVTGAVTQLSQLRGQTTSAAVLQGEQIPTARLSSGNLPGGALGLQKGYQAVTVQLAAQQIVGPALQRGAHVTIYGAFQGATTKSLKPGVVAGPQPNISGLVMPVVPDVRVIDVIRPGVTPGQQASDQGALVTLELLPIDAEKVVFAQQNGTMWLALLVPGEEGVAAPPIDFLQLAKKKP